MLRNLKEIHRSDQDVDRQLAVQERLLVLLPDAWPEYRDRGLLHAQRGQTAQAAKDLQVYLDHAEDALDRDEVAERLADLRRASH
jgi:regulator of sirC expression with transglutaminase-like and TPR domain